MPKFLNGLIILVFLVLSVNSANQFFAHKRQADTAAKWPTSTATITASDIDAGQRGGMVAFFRPRVYYQFNAGGHVCGGQTISYPDPRSIDKEVAEVYLKKYQVGLRVPVYYDVADPSKSCLEPGDNKTLMSEFYWSLGFLLAAGVTFLLNRD